MKKLLFVDDEQWVLDFLRMSLRTLANEWQMEYVLSAEEGLRLLAESIYDVVLADIHLTGMSGIQLLHEVKKRYPQTVRIAFSGAAGQDSVGHALKVAHQVLPKPLTPGMLRASLTRACALRDQVTNDSVERLVSGIRDLPTIPTLYEELLGVLESQDSSAERVANVIARDPGMTANLLRVANSVYFNLRNSITSPTQAVALLGVENVKSMVLGFKVVHDVKRSSGNQSEVQEVWRHGFAVATHARTIASMEDVGSVVIENAFLAGLLHDIGRLVLQTNLPKEYAAVAALTKEKGVSVSQAERDVFGTTHAQVGAYLLGKWGLRDCIVEAVAFHHEPMLCLQPGFSVLAAIHVANAWDQEATTSYSDPPALDRVYIEHAGLISQLPRWRAGLAA
ncbi:signal transduction protein [Nitrospira sp.]|nr:signal transduction protein [Nitrospira sp.]